jgi:hypothetical protein
MKEQRGRPLKTAGIRLKEALTGAQLARSNPKPPIGGSFAALGGPRHDQALAALRDMVTRGTSARPRHEAR